MKISMKMTIIFSVMMIIAVAILTSYATQRSLQDSSDITTARFRNMGATIAEAIEQQINMMDLAVEELTDNTSFMAALNQFVRDDSDDRKMATAARNAVVQQLYRSPLIDNFYRVTFYTRDGDFVTSRVEKDDYLDSSTPQAQQVISTLPWLDAVDAEPAQRRLLAPHGDFLSVRRDISVYGIVRAVLFHGKPIGYLEVSNTYQQLQSVMEAAEEDTVRTQAVFDDGTLYYASAGVRFDYPDDLEDETLTDWTDAASGLRQSVMRIRIEWLGLNLYLAQDHSIIEEREQAIRLSNLQVMILITIPTLAVIAFVCSRLTRSIRLLTRKVRQLPVDNLLQDSSLSETVTAASDREIHELEHVFNSMMLRLRDSTMNERAMREGTLQAQLSALQTQINPHFIYNTLNIISAKSMESGNLEVIELCDQFAQMLRYSTDTRSRTATLAAEIDNVRNYLLVAKARYEENLEFVIDIPAQLGSIEIPKLTLQPIVENALSHGYDGQNVKRCLSVTGHVEKDQLILEIRDNGTGFSPETLERLQAKIRTIETGQASIEESGGHIGLANTCLRLHYYSRGTMHMYIRNDHGAVVRLTMPCA